MKTIGGRFRAAALMAAAASCWHLQLGLKAQNQNSQGQNSNDKQGSNGNSRPNDNAWPYGKTGRSPVLAVVGDISCQPDAISRPTRLRTKPATPPRPHYTSTTSAPPGSTAGYSLWQSQEATANQIETMKPDAVALLGDLQYQVGQYQDFEQSFDLTYGGFKFLHAARPRQPRVL